MHTLASFALLLVTNGDERPELPPVTVFGLELPVRDVAAAERVYSEAFGFRSSGNTGELARLEKDGLALVLVRTTSVRPPAGAADVHLNLETGDLEAAVERALAAGLDAPDPEPRPNPIGRAVTVIDADGHRTNLIELARGSTLEGDTTAVFNLGLDLEKDADWEFVERLGLSVLTRAYVPDALPIAKSGAAELVLHREASGPRPASTAAAALLLGVDELTPATQPALVERGFLAREGSPRPSPLGRRLALRTPSNVRVDLVERSDAQLAFERLCGLAGSWEGRSSQGWTARIEIEVIARGSAVLERSNFEAHPGETMLTLFHRDGADLVLTHYCVAGNQPRLVASEIDPARLHFTFRDATNLAARDVGHMDECVLRFEGPDAFSSVWSFYQDGQTSWAEEIHYRRLAAATSASAPSR